MNDPAAMAATFPLYNKAHLVPLEMPDNRSGDRAVPCLTYNRLLTCQSSDDSASSIANMIPHHETEYKTSLEDLQRKLPVTCTLFPQDNTLQFSLTREITKEFGIGK